MKIIMLVGVSGSGKSTWASGTGVDVVSSDSIREWVFGDATNQHPSIWRVIRSVIRAKIEARLSDELIIDATFAKRRDRVAMINDIRSWMEPEDTLEAIYFDVPKDVILERNESRERQVPRHAIDAQYSALKANPPSLEDGFDALRTHF